MLKLSTFLLGSAALLIQQFADLYKEIDLDLTLKELQPDLNLPRVKTYDFIVVGGGTAGCLVAERLSQHFSVLLLEKGGSPPPMTYNPSRKLDIISHPAINDPFRSTKQKYYALSSGGFYTHWLGRMLGGSGSHNDNIYNRGNPEDYNAWAELVDDDSWSYKNVLKHFKSFENFVGFLINENERDKYYARGGPFTVDTDTPPYLSSWLNAGVEFGYKIGDPNGYQQEGFAPLAKSVWNGSRVSGYTSFIKPIEGKRSTLTVQRYSFVDKILITDDHTAYGVRYKRHGIPQIAHASKEVIISAGTVASPILLVKSGLGPAELLESIKIPVVSDIKGVGAVFLDHVGIWMPFKANNKLAYDAIYPHMYTDHDFIEELKEYQSPIRHGIFDDSLGPQAFIVSSEAHARGDHTWPDVQLCMSSNANLADTSRVFFVGVILGRHLSVGKLVFNRTAFLAGDTDDINLAQIDFAFFTNRVDVNVIVEGILLSFDLLTKTEAFRHFNVTYAHATPESCGLFDFGTEEFWSCVVQYRTTSIWHMTSTCTMGREDDPMAVVNSKLKVRGMRRLRVVDASVMPHPTNANINAAVLLVAEKGSSEILKEHLAVRG